MFRPRLDARVPGSSRLLRPRPGRPRPRERPRNHLRLHARHTDFAVEVPPPDQGRHPQRHPLPPGTREQGQEEARPQDDQACPRYEHRFRLLRGPGLPGQPAFRSQVSVDRRREGTGQPAEDPRQDRDLRRHRLCGERRDLPGLHQYGILAPGEERALDFQRAPRPDHLHR